MKKYKKGEYRDQFVIAYLTNLDNYKSIVLWAEKFALMLKKGLILLYIADEYSFIHSSSFAAISVITYMRECLGMKKL